MYDPDRSQNVRYLGEDVPYDAFVRGIQTGLRQQGATRGAGLRILTETVTSPTLAAQMQALLKKFPARNGTGMTRLGRTTPARARALPLAVRRNAVSL
jgi:hypothetical protein